MTSIAILALRVVLLLNPYIRLKDRELASKQQATAIACTSRKSARHTAATSKWECDMRVGKCGFETCELGGVESRG